MRTIICLLLLLFMQLSSAAEGDVPQTLDEAKQLRDNLFNEMQEWGRFPTPDVQMTRPLFLLRFLDSDKAEIRAVAVDAFSKINLIHLDECIPYLDAKRPLAERMPLLVLCANQWGAYSEAFYSDKSAQQLREIIKDTLNNELCPPKFPELIAAIAYHNHFYQKDDKPAPILSMIDSNTEALVAKRLLANLGEVRKRYPVDEKDIYRDNELLLSKILNMVLAMDEKSAGPCLEEWYRVEGDDKIREVLVDRGLKWSNSDQWSARRQALLILAAKDWNRNIAEQARSLIEK
jgi:hypothetical protein